MLIVNDDDVCHRMTSRIFEKVKASAFNYQKYVNHSLLSYRYFHKPYIRCNILHLYLLVMKNYITFA